MAGIISQPASLASSTSNPLSLLPLPSVVADSLAKFGIFQFAGSGKQALGRLLFGFGKEGWVSKQVLGTVLVLVASLLVLEQVSPTVFFPCSFLSSFFSF
jgi:hypothetical protein